MKVLDLFSGIGGFSLGLHRAGMTTVAFCEIEPYPQAVLRKNFPGVPIYDDVRTVTAERLRTDGITRVDLVCGGFPCQPFSVAGKQQGKDDHRHLWPEMFRIIQETKPTWVIGENVAGFVSMALDEVWSDLENQGYEVQPFIIPACAFNANHRRDRVWIIAHAASEQNDRERGNSELGRYAVERSEQATLCDNKQADNNCACGCSKAVLPDTSRQLRDGSGSARAGRSSESANGCADVANAVCKHGDNGGYGTGAVCGKRSETANVCTSQTDGDTNGAGREEQHSATVAARPGQCAGELVATGPDWTVESPFCGVADGIPRRVDRLKCLGNAVVPQIPEIIGRAIMAVTYLMEESCNSTKK
ncbi:MAG TPA: DNA (cytosine-5-)-methyltransferase [Geobacter sp.]|nr:DNA (cytosine-5-)-methyltransferase [Geobacter sp.]